MKKRTACAMIGIAMLSIIIMNVPAIISNQKSSRAFELVNTKQSEIPKEELQVIIAMADNFDIGEKIYIGIAGIRNAKASYVKPLSIKVDIVSNEFEQEFLVSSREGYYEGSSWVEIVDRDVKRYNDFIYYSTFSSFGADAILTARVTMKWLAPWHELITSIEQKQFTIGSYYNISSSVAEKQKSIKNIVLDKINVGVEFGLELINNVQEGIDMILKFVTQLKTMIESASVDPANLNFYIVDLVGTSASKGPLYDLVRNDLYEGRAEDKDTLMASRHLFIMNSIKDSLSVLDAKLGPDHDASDGSYSYTVSFVRSLYETYTPDNLYINPDDAVDTISKIVYSNSMGNITGSSWTSAYNSGIKNGPNDVSLEFLLESMTGDHPKFKDTRGAKWNEKPARKSIVINTMGQYWPIFNSWYMYHERTPGDRPALSIIDSSEVPSLAASYGVRKGFSNSLDVMTNMRRIVLNYDTTALDGGSSRWSTKKDMFDAINPLDLYFGFNIVNFTYYMKKLSSGMADSYYYWINLGGGQPFSKMTRDITYDYDLPATGGITEHCFSDRVHDVILELDGTIYRTKKMVAGVPTVMNAHFEIPDYFNHTMFQLIDWFARITNDRWYFKIEAKPIGSTNTEYYKIDTGRWIDAFFNGTDLSLRDGSLASANYITAKETSTVTYPWKSAKAPNYSFMFEDSWVFYRLGLLSGYKVPNEYVWTAFVGANKQVPIGWLTGPNMWYSVVGTDDMRMALEYLYGGIFMGYKETVLGYKNLAMTMILAAAEGTNVPEAKLNYLLQQIDALDVAWGKLDLGQIDIIGQNIMDAINEKDPVTKQSIPQQVLGKIANRTALAYAVISKDQSQYSYIDTGLVTAGSDLSLQGVTGIGGILLELISSNIEPAIDQCRIMITNVFATINATKKSVFNTTMNLANNAFGFIQTSFTTVMDGIRGFANRTAEGFNTVGDTIINVSKAVNSTLISLTKGVVNWTETQLSNMGAEVQKRLGMLGEFINDTVFSLIDNIVEQITKGLVSITDGAHAISNQIINAIKGIDDTVLNLCTAGGGLIGAAGGGAVGFALGGPVGGLVGAGAGAIGGALVGGAIGKELANVISKYLEPIADGAQTLNDNLYGGISKGIANAHTIVTNIISLARSGSLDLINRISGAIGVVTDRTIKFTNDLGKGVTNVISFATGLGVEFGGAVKTFGGNVASGITSAVGSAEQLADRALTWSKATFQKLMESNIAMVTTIIMTVKSSISSTLSLVQIVLEVMKQVSTVLENLVSQLNTAFVQIGEVFESVAGFLVDLAGKTINFALDFSGNLAKQLTVIEKQIQSSTGFYVNMGGLFQQIHDSRTAASLLEYAQQTMGNDKEIFYKWADVVQPISNAKGGDSSFRVFQMGQSFADKLYFVVEYQGKPVTANEIRVLAMRPLMGDEVVPGDFLQATIPAYAEHYSNGTTIPGIYYSSFSSTTLYQWYGSGPAPVKTEAPRIGDYLVRVDANYTTPISSPHEGAKLNNTWMERTTLYNATYAIDAFPVMTIISSYAAPVAAGTAQTLRISVGNEMYSKPTVNVEISLSTNEGFVISSRKIANIILPSEGEGNTIYEFTWTPLSSTPGGSYNMLVTIVETNGDVTTRIVPVTIQAESIFTAIIGWFIGIISSILGFFGISLLVMQKRRPRMPSLDTAMLSSQGNPVMSFMKNAKSSSIDCSPSGVLNGKCSVNLKCDPKTGSCKIDF